MVGPLEQHPDRIIHELGSSDALPYIQDQIVGSLLVNETFSDELKVPGYILGIVRDNTAFLPQLKHDIKPKGYAGSVSDVIIAVDPDVENSMLLDYYGEYWANKLTFHRGVQLIIRAVADSTHRQAGGGFEKKILYHTPWYPDLDKIPRDEGWHGTNTPVRFKARPATWAVSAGHDEVLRQLSKTAELTLGGSGGMQQRTKQGSASRVKKK